MQAAGVCKPCWNKAGTQSPLSHNRRCHTIAAVTPAEAGAACFVGRDISKSNTGTYNTHRQAEAETKAEVLLRAECKAQGLR